MPRLVLQNISKRFGATEALEDISFSLKEGEILALLGDNGAGKSTLIKIISGFHAPTSGKISWEGQEITFPEHSPQRAREMGIQTVYQHLGLVDELSLTRNFFLGVEPTRQWGPFRWLDQKRMREILKKELASQGLKRKLDPEAKVSLLSGGERQALAIARARYFGAKLLILDEPTSALSLRQTKEVLAYVREAASSQGISVIFITHTFHHVEEIADRMVIIQRGRVQGNFVKGEKTVQECADMILHQ